MVDQRISGLRITNYGLRITDYGLRITNYGLRITNYGLRITDYGSFNHPLNSLRIYPKIRFGPRFAPKGAV